MAATLSFRGYALSAEFSYAHLLVCDYFRVLRHSSNLLLWYDLEIDTHGVTYCYVAAQI